MNILDPLRIDNLIKNTEKSIDNIQKQLKSQKSKQKQKAKGKQKQRESELKKRLDKLQDIFEKLQNCYGYLSKYNLVNSRNFVNILMKDLISYQNLTPTQILDISFHNYSKTLPRGLFSRSGRVSLPSFLFPESLESAKWYGGWGAGGKVIRPVLPYPHAALVVLGYYLFTVAMADTHMLLLLPDQAVGFSHVAMRRTIGLPALRRKMLGIDDETLVKAPQLTRSLAAELLTGGTRGQKLVLLFLTKRVDVVETVPASVVGIHSLFAASLSEMTSLKLLKMISRSFINTFATNEMKGDRDRAQSEAIRALHIVARGAVDVAMRHRTPDEVLHEFARETYMSHPTFIQEGIVTPEVLRDIRRGLKALSLWL